MDEFIGYALLVIVIFFIHKRFFKHPPPSPEQPQPLPPTQPPTEEAPPVERTFEEQWQTGPLLCDGLACNPKNPCSGPERWLCRDVISKVVPAGYFSGQFWLQLPSGSRRIDFAIETPNGKRIAVELDGYNAHVENLKRGSFDDQLLRQNELTCAGWAVLRFSFDQLRRNAELCSDMLNSVMICDGDQFNKTPVLKAGCPNPECGGQVRRFRSRSENFFWSCSKCRKTFDSDTIIPGI